MTVPSEQSRITYDTDGASASFPVPFRFLQNRDLRVTLIAADDSSRLLVLDVDYSVTGAGQQSGGTLSKVDTLAAGATLLIERIVPITQETAYQRNDPFPERAHEQALDKLTMICQQLAAAFGMTSLDQRRVLMVRDTDRDGIGFLPLRADRASMVLGFDANGDPIAVPSDLPAIEGALQRAEQAATTATEEAADAADSASAANAGAVSAGESAFRAENAATAAALGIGTYYPTISAGRTAVADGESFWVEPNSADGLTRFTMFTRTSTTTQAKKFEVIQTSDVDGLANHVAEMISPVGTNSILVVVDAGGNKTMEQTSDGSLMIPGLGGKSVQDSIADAASSGGNETNMDDDILVVHDAAGQTTMRQAADGALYIPGLGGKSVQDSLSGNASESFDGTLDLVRIIDANGGLAASIKSDGALIVPILPDIGIPEKRNQRDRLSQKSAEYIDVLLHSGAKHAPAPFNLLPQDYSPDGAFIDALALPDEWPERLILDSPYYRDDRFVHPYLLEFYAPFRGYRYLLCINPYAYEPHENPVIYGSNDLHNFKMLDGFRQPLAQPMIVTKSFLSDSGFTYDPVRGELLCYWRETVRPDGATGNDDTDTTLYCRATTDGYGWSDTRVIIGPSNTTVDEIISPSILFDPVAGIWHMWVTNNSTGGLRHRTAPDVYGPWTIVSDSDPVGIALWHSEIKRVGDKFVCLINKRDPNSNLALAISDDGYSWRKSPINLFSSGQDAMYKGTFLPVFDENGDIALTVAWTTNHAATPDGIRRVYVSQTNYVRI